MQKDDLLGRYATFTVRRLGPAGATLARDPSEGPSPALLLPRDEVPDGTREGDRVEAFVYLDDDGRRAATLREPKVTVGRVAFLEVTEVDRGGAFVDWGMPTTLFVPREEQTRDVGVGERHPVGLFVDGEGRLTGTMRVTEMLRDVGGFREGEWVRGEAWRDETRVGLFVIVERRFVGLLPAEEPHELARGEAARFRVANVLPDGKIVLSLRGRGHEEIESDAARVLARLSRPGAPRLGDHSSPEAIREAVGLSKKAFKRAVGNLLKRGAVTLDREGFVTPPPARRGR